MLLRFAALVWVLAMALGGSALAQIESPAGAPSRNIAEMRGRMQELQREREKANAARDLIPLKQSSRTPPAAQDSKSAAVCIVNAMSRLRAILTLEPVDGGAADLALRIPVCIKGEQWIALPAGRWRAKLEFGSLQTGRMTQLDPFEIAVQNGKRYELVLDAGVEQKLRDRLDRLEKKPAAAAKGNSTDSQPEEKPAEKDEAVPFGSVSVEIKKR